MIISASYRTDIPAFHAAWFHDRLQDGSVTVKNPYGRRDFTVSLRPEDVDGFVFWTRNPLSFLPVLDQIAGQGCPFVIQTTVTGMPRTLEHRTPERNAMVAAIQRMRDLYGPDAVVWRFDPILDTPAWPLDRQHNAFEDLCKDLKGAVNEVCVSWATLYRKSLRNLGKAGIAANDPPVEEKRAFLSDLACIAAGHDLTLSVCSQPDLVPKGAIPAACIDGERLSRVAGKFIRSKPKPNRPGCLCAESRDIGGYDSCGHGCLYCYAVSDHEKVRDRLRSSR